MTALPLQELFTLCNGHKNVVDLIDVLPVVVYRNCSVNLVSVALLGLTTFKMIEVRVYRNIALTVLDFPADLPIRILALL